MLSRDHFRSQQLCHCTVLWYNQTNYKEEKTRGKLQIDVVEVAPPHCWEVVLDGL